MCAILFNGGTVQQWGVGEGGDFLYFRSLIYTSPQYIDRVYFVLYLAQKNHLKGFRLSHWRTLAVA
jgi:hypothetical protein